ncbi:4522_t:CDS:2, partial [Racocetra persica]
AYEVLGDEIKRKKYDLCFLNGEEGEYLNRKKLVKLKQSGELVDKDFRKSIELILQDELKINNLIWEDLNEFGAKVELMKIEEFCQEVLSDEMSQYEAIQITKKYVKIIDEVCVVLNEAKRIKGKYREKSAAVKMVEEKYLAEEP